jgi:hypothetical protein
MCAARLCLAFLRFLYMIRIRQVSAQVRGRATVTRMQAQEPIRLQMEQALERADEVLAEGRDRVQALRSPGADCDLTEALAALGAKLAIDQTAHFCSTVAYRFLPRVHDTPPRYSRPISNV